MTYRGASLIRNNLTLGHYSRPGPVAVLGGGAVSYEGGTPAPSNKTGGGGCTQGGSSAQWLILFSTDDLTSGAGQEASRGPCGYLVGI